jgi:hypothetical protein
MTQAEVAQLAGAILGATIAISVVVIHRMTSPTD